MAIAPLFAAAGAEQLWQVTGDILVLVAAAIVLGALAERVRVSSIVGYLIGGMLVGPGALRIVTGQERIAEIAELGVILLMFAIGLEFSPKKLLQLGRIPLVAGPLQLIGTLLVGALLALAMNSSLVEAITVGAMVSLSSTVCILRVLQERSELDSRHGRAALGVLLFQDVAVVPLVLLVSAVTKGGGLGATLLVMGRTGAIALALVGLLILVFRYVVPRIHPLSALHRNRDFPVLLAILLSGGAAWLSHQGGISPSLGAFVAGVLLAVSPFAPQIRSDIQPLRALFVALFFGAIGMLGDLGWLANHALPVAGLTLVLIVGKSLIAALSVRASGVAWRAAVVAGVGLSQIGEFSFVIATVARDPSNTLPGLSTDSFNFMVSMTLASLVATPLIFEGGHRLAAMLKRHADDEDAPRPRDAREEDPSARARRRILVIGFGPAAQTMLESFTDDDRAATIVVDLALNNVLRAQSMGAQGEVGDALQFETIEHLALREDCIVIVTVPDPRTVNNMVALLRRRLPEADIIARGRYHRHCDSLREAGADQVVDEESNVGLALAATFRDVLGSRSSQDEPVQ